jgi:hypothetical protein
MEKCLFEYHINQKISECASVEESVAVLEKLCENYVMCKSKESRSLAYDIVTRLHELSTS